MFEASNDREERTMQITLTFETGTPDVSPGNMRYFFVRVRSSGDHKVRVIGAYYLNEFPLEFEDGPCPQCPCPDGDIDGQECSGAAGDGCPWTGWYDEKWHPEYDTAYHRLDGEVLGFAKQPDPTA